MKTLTTLVLLLLVAIPAVAQEREIRDANLPRALEARLLDMYAGQAERFDGAVTIHAGQVVRSHMAVMGGPLRIAGTVEGDVAMVGGDVIMDPGGSVTGNVTVVSGEVHMADDAVVGGTITAYGVPAAPGRIERDRRERDRRERDREADREARRPGDPDVRRGDLGYSRLTVRSGVSYNRVEGLPVMFGPVLETAGSRPLRLEALAIWRTESGASLATDRMGYRVLAEQFVTADRMLSVGGSLYSVVQPLDRWQISDLEASLATVLFHQDFRDHFDRTGWNGFVRVRPVRGMVTEFTYRDERHSAIPAGDPWALFNRSDSWRHQPVAAEGRVRTVGGSVELDRRDRRDLPRSGWLARVSAERPVGGSLTRPALGAALPGNTPGWDGPVAGVIPAMEADLGFTTGLVDIRRYSPVGYRSGVNMRVVAGGSVDGTPLPPQYQHALGGPGTLPGFDAFHGDCGARRATGVHDGDRYFAAYGCDRFALGQVEYRGKLSLDFGFGEPRRDRRSDWWRDVSIDTSPTWVVFMDAGRGWALADPVSGDDVTRTTGTLVDAGLGFLIGRLGFYAALPLNSEVDQSPRFHLRWGSRF
jgi:hypothetical protein